MTILVRCSDPRINNFLDSSEIKSKLFLDSGVALIADTGSIKYFMHKDQVDDFFEQLDILVYHFNSDKIVLLNHTDCGYYKKLNEDKEDIYLSDLVKMKELIRKKYSEVQTLGYLMDTKTGELMEA